MKKLFALALAVMMLLTACAFAEMYTYVQTAITDAEGNILDVETPVLVFGFDDETMECAFGTADETVEGTCTVAAQDDELLVLECALADGSSYTMTYVIAEDSFGFEDADELIHVFMPYIEEEAN